MVNDIATRVKNVLHDLNIPLDLPKERIELGGEIVRNDPEISLEADPLVLVTWMRSKRAIVREIGRILFLL